MHPEQLIDPEVRCLARPAGRPVRRFGRGLRLFFARARAGQATTRPDFVHTRQNGAETALTEDRHVD